MCCSGVDVERETALKPSTRRHDFSLNCESCKATQAKSKNKNMMLQNASFFSLCKCNKKVQVHFHNRAKTTTTTKLCKETTTLYLCSQQICAVIAVWEIHANHCRSSYNDTIVLCLDQRSYVVVSQKLTSHMRKSMSTFLFTISHSCLELHPTSPSELIQEESGDFWLTERIAASPLHLSLSADCLSDYLQPEKNTCAPFEVRAQVQ